MSAIRSGRRSQRARRCEVAASLRSLLLGQQKQPNRRRKGISPEQGGAFSARPGGSGGAVAEGLEGFVEAALAGVGGFGLGDGQHEGLLAAEREGREVGLGGRIAREGVGEVGGQGKLARCGIELDVDVDLVAARDVGFFAVLGADTDHEDAAHHGDGVAIGVAIDRDPHRRTFSSAERLNDLIGHLNAGRGFATLQQAGAEFHSSDDNG